MIFIGYEVVGTIRSSPNNKTIEQMLGNGHRNCSSGCSGGGTTTTTETGHDDGTGEAQTSELNSEKDAGSRNAPGESSGNATASSCSSTSSSHTSNNSKQFIGSSIDAITTMISTITNHSISMKTTATFAASAQGAGTSAQGSATSGGAESRAAGGREPKELEADRRELRELRIDVGQDSGCLGSEGNVEQRIGTGLGLRQGLGSKSEDEDKFEVRFGGSRGELRTEEQPEVGQEVDNDQTSSDSGKTDEGGCTTPLATEQPQQGTTASSSSTADHLYPPLTALSGHLSVSQPEIGPQSQAWSEIETRGRSQAKNKADTRDSSRSLERSDTLKADDGEVREESATKLVRVRSTGACPTNVSMPPALPFASESAQLIKDGVEPRKGKVEGADKKSDEQRPKFDLGPVSPNVSFPRDSTGGLESGGVKSLKAQQQKSLAESVSSPSVMGATTGSTATTKKAPGVSCGDLESKEKTPSVPPRTKKRRVTELKCSEVRWFYRRKLVETKWTPFAGCDSLMLEVYWRTKFGVDLDVQTSHHLAAISGSGALATSKIAVMDGLYTVADDSMTTIQAIYWKEDEMEIRRGTWFLVESLQPINPDMADPIEKHHLHVFRSQNIPDTPVFSEKETSKKPLLTELKLQDQYEVRWNSVIDTTLYNNSKTSRLFRYITWGKGTQLKRGYEEACWEDGKRKISHLIMVVHGIGQKGYENLIAKNSEQVRDAIYAVMEKHYPDEESRPMVLPVEWRSQLILDNGVTDQVTLPKMSTMRHALNAIAMDIMYYQSPLYRNEIMAGLVRSLNTVYNLFMSNHPDYDGPISLYAHSLGSVMCYDLLTSWSPLVLFDDYVAEAIDNHLTKSTTKDVAVLHDFQSARQKLLDHYGGFQKAFSNPNEQLNFKVTNLFCIGSPLAVFLIMRGATNVYPTADQLKRIYNIFHPYDPVAYRLEPLIHTNYQLIKPMKLFTSIDLRALRDYDQLPLELHRSYIKKLKAREKREKESREAKDMNTRSERGHEHEGDHDADDMIAEDDYECDSDESSALRPNSSCSSPRSLTPPPYESTAIVEQQQQQRKGWWKFGGGTSKKEKEREKETSNIEVAKEMEETKLNDLDKLIDEIPVENRLLYRMDFQVQPQITDRSYWSVLKSHFAYWTNADVATFIVNQLYKDDGNNEDDNEHEGAAASTNTTTNNNNNICKGNCYSNNNIVETSQQDSLSKQNTGYSSNVIGEVGTDTGPLTSPNVAAK